MKIHDVENMDAAELKSKKQAASEALAHRDAAELARRYVQARLDAKQRDEKLAEQGRTIQMLQNGFEKCEADLSEMKKQRDQLTKELEKVEAQSKHQSMQSGEQIQSLESEIHRLEDELLKRENTIAGLRQQANAYDSAMSQINKLAHDAMAKRLVEETAKK